MTTSIHGHLQAQTARQRENAQAAPRPARTRFSISTTGIGEHRLVGKAALDFGAHLLEEPSFSYGVILGDQLPIGQLPVVNAFVLRFIQTGGLWTGAEMGFNVDCVKSDIHLKWSLTFEASALRTTQGVGSQTLPSARGTNATTINTGDMTQ